MSGDNLPFWGQSPILRRASARVRCGGIAGCRLQGHGRRLYRSTWNIASPPSLGRQRLRPCTVLVNACSTKVCDSVRAGDPGRSRIWRIPISQFYVDASASALKYNPAKPIGRGSGRYCEPSPCRPAGGFVISSRQPAGEGSRGLESERDRNADLGRSGGLSSNLWEVFIRTTGLGIERPARLATRRVLC